MIISAKEAQRLTKTRWQIELYELDILIKNAIWEGKKSIFYEGTLCEVTIEYLMNIGYAIDKINKNVFKIDWSE